MTPPNDEASDPQDKCAGFEGDESHAAREWLPCQKLVAAVSGAGGEVDGDRDEKMRDESKDMNTLNEIIAVLLLVESC